MPRKTKEQKDLKNKENNVKTSTTIITSGDEEPVETTTDVNMDLSGVYAKYQAAGTATVNYDDMEIIKVSHDHGHDHGHGTGNAGGGIIEAE